MAAHKLSAFRLSPLHALQLSTERTVDPARQETAWTTRLALGQVTTYHASFAEDVAACRKAGIPALGIWQRKLAECGIGPAAEMLRANDLEVSSLSWAGGFTGTDGRTYLQAVYDGCAAVHKAAAVGARTLVVYTGTRGTHTYNHARGMVVDALRRLGDEAAPYGIQIAVQPLTGQLACKASLREGLDTLLDLLNRCGHQHVGLMFDLFHLWNEPDLLARREEWLTFVKLVALSDWKDAATDVYSRCELGEGLVPLVEVISLLEAGGYRGCYELQLWSKQVWNSDRAALLDRSREAFAALGSFQYA